MATHPGQLWISMLAALACLTIFVGLALGVWAALALSSLMSKEESEDSKK